MLVGYNIISTFWEDYIMKIKIKKMFFYLSTTSDDSYWDEKATEVTYLSKLHNTEAPPIFDADGSSLYEKARSSVGHVSFEKLLSDLDVEVSYSSLTKTQLGLAVSFGIIGVFAAHFTNGQSEKLEDFFLKLHEPFKQGTSPLDYRSGAKHRYIFGHDFNFWQELPKGYTFGGKDIGGQTLYSLVINHIKDIFPESGIVGVHINAILHIITHYLSDLPTHDGLPLPFSSLFTEWATDQTKASKYKASNSLMDELGREYGTINAADIASYAIIKLLIKSFHVINFRGENVDDNHKEHHLAQMSTVAYGTAIIIQMMLIVSGGCGRTGKLNYLIAGPFLWNAGKSVLLSNKMHKKVLDDYDISIAILSDNSKTIDDWVKNQCK